MSNTWLTLGIDFTLARNWPKAMKALEKSVELEADDVVYVWLGYVYNEVGRHQDAVDTVQLYINTHPTDSIALNNKGSALIELKRFNDAIVCLDQALRENPEYAEAFNNKGSAYNGLKEFEYAIISLKACLALNPNHVNALNNMGFALMGLDRDLEALESFSKGLELSPTHPNLLYNLADAHHRLNNLEEAKKYYSKCVEGAPDSLEFRLLLGELCCELGTPLEGLPHFKAVVKLSPANTKAILGVGRCHMLNHAWAKGIKWFSKCLEVDPNHTSALNMKGFCLSESGKMQESLVYFDKCLAIDKDFTTAWNNKGCALVRLNSQLDEALHCYESAIALLPEYGQAWRNKIHIFLKMKRNAEALQAMFDFNLIEPTDEYCLTSILELCDDDAKILALFQKAWGEEHNLTFLPTLANKAAETGQPELAQNYLNIALESAPLEVQMECCIRADPARGLLLFDQQVLPVGFTLYRAYLDCCVALQDANRASAAYSTYLKYMLDEDGSEKEWATSIAVHTLKHNPLASSLFGELMAIDKELAYADWEAQVEALMVIWADIASSGVGAG